MINSYFFRSSVYTAVQSLQSLSSQPSPQSPQSSQSPQSLQYLLAHLRVARTLIHVWRKVRMQSGSGGRSKKIRVQVYLDVR